MKKNTFKFFLSILTGILLTLSFPKFGYSTLIYVSLVPLLFSLSKSSYKEAIFISFLSGFTFFITSLIWIINVTKYVDNFFESFGILIGYFVLCSYCALFFIPFGIITKWCFDKWFGLNILKNIRIMISITFLWVSLEFLRSILFSGFPWNSLGISQYLNPSIIQIASIGGVSIVTALIVWMNIGVFITLKLYTSGINKKKYRPHYEFLIGILPIALSISFGIQTIFSSNKKDQENFTVALIQPNVNQAEINKLKTNSDRLYGDKIRNSSQNIYNKISDEIDRAIINKNVDLVVIPETSLDYFNSSFFKKKLIDKVTEKTSLLAGTTFSKFRNKKVQYFNASILYDKKIGNSIPTKYFKQHLVPFGEYNPFDYFVEKFLPLENINFSCGNKSVIFSTNGSPEFSVLICFEDIFSSLARKAVLNNAKWLINQTNDGWFDPSFQSEQHLAHSVFRCVENNIPMARACNTGITCLIDSKGRIKQRLDSLEKGFLISTLEIENNFKKTYFSKNGEIFAKISFIISFLTLCLFSLDLKKAK